MLGAGRVNMYFTIVWTRGIIGLHGLRPLRNLVLYCRPQSQPLTKTEAAFHRCFKLFQRNFQKNICSGIHCLVKLWFLSLQVY